MIRVKLSYAAAIVSIAALALAGCAQEPAAAPSARATASASVTPAAATEPSPSRDLACPDLSSAAQATALAAQPVASVDPALYENVDSRYTSDGVTTETGMLPSFTIQQGGGLSCEWSNGKYHDTGSTSASDYAGLRVQVLFDRGDTKPYGADFDPGPVCDSGSSCRFTKALTDGSWLIVALQLPWDLNNVTHPDTTAMLAAFTTAVDGMKTAIAAAKPTGSTWTPAGTLLMPTECAGVITPDEVKGALGLPYGLMTSHGDGYATADAVAQQQSGDSCSWTSATDDHDGYVGGLAFLRGGAWAWKKAQQLPSALGARQALDLPGLTAKDQAWVRCDAAHTSCIADLVVGGNWIELTLALSRQSVAGYGIPTVDRLAAITILATDVVAVIRP